MLFAALHAIFGVLWLCAAGLGCGAWIGSRLPSTFTELQRLAFSLLGGLGLLSLLLFLVGQLTFTRPIIFSVTFLALLLAIRPLLRALRDYPRVKSPLSPALLPAAIVVAILLVTAVAGLAQTTGDWNNDAVAYHFLGPRVWLREGVIRPVPDNSLTAFPAIPETLFAALYATGGDRAPDFSSAVGLGLLLAISISLTRRLGLTSRQALWSAAIIATMPAVYAGSHGGFVDGLYAAFILAAARIGFDAVHPREWAIFGMFCGFAMGTKYTALLAVPALLACCAWATAAKDRQFFSILQNLGIVAAIAGFVATPFYLRNSLLLGCPVYPPPPAHLLSCTPKYLSPQALDDLRNYVLQRGSGLGRGWLAFLKLPWNLTLYTANFHGGGGIGLCPLGLAPFGAIALRKNQFAQLLLVLALLLTSLWFATQQESRFLIHVYAIAAVFSVAGWKYIATRTEIFSRVLAVMIVAVSIAYGGLMIERAQAEKLHAVFSPSFAQQRAVAEIPYFAAFEFLNGTPAVQKVLILDRSVTPFYSQKPYLKPIGTWNEHTIPGIAVSIEALPQAHQLKISHVLDVVSPLSGFQVPAGFPGLTLVFDSANQRVYRVD
jgi:dolichyl-phosphate-mannose-protein mannosyltransferase